MSTNQFNVKSSYRAGSPRGFAVRAAGTLTAAGLFGLLGAAPAVAHVHAESEDAAKGGYGTVTFRVPNEQDDAATTKIEVTFPAQHPVGGATVKPVPGWQAKVRTESLATPVGQGEAQVDEAVTTITWTGGQIRPDEFQEFTVRLGPLPTKTDQLLLPTAQTYDNGDVVRWEQPTGPGGEEPERPAPLVELAAAGSDGHGAGAGSGGTAHGAGHGESGGASGGEQASAGAAGTDDTARWLGGAGLAVGALGLGVGAGAVIQARRSTARRTSGAGE